ncbi:prepilin peptidase [Cellulomonas pakistanensis]|uniref:Prepilin leader peptidase/N-methyltransferase n=1 Tax=Cellulomonas pakistanensis TaxID=992287 RepID=A0A919P698_9CELL|nr:A24 family peptidase [Cellulomonas pakistanensis]GIG35114.1 prepilin peptidase [Cellulomonas pakistanensis]
MTLDVLVVLLAGILGLVIGSFLNVVVWRVPRGESVVAPPSSCPRCGHRIRSRDNVPVLSWLVLRGRCRDCGEPISARYPAVEAVTGLLFAVLAAQVGLSWVLPAVLYLAAVGVALTLIDIDVQRLPDRIVLPSYPVGALLLALASWNPGGEPDWSALVRAAIGCVGLYVFYFAAAFAYPRGMGFGDVKLAGVLGLYLAWFGWGAFAVGAFAAFLLGGVYSVGLLVARRADRKSGIPFGPWMLGGALVGLLFGEMLWNAYLGLFL